MAKEALVDADVRAAAELVKLLDQNNLNVSGALWFYQSEAERWRLLISFLEKRRDVTTYYLEVAKLINKSGRKDIIDLGLVDFVDSDRSVIGPLSRAIRVEGLSNVRFSHNRINNVFIEDALIYRLAA
jgi:hypothetical protein